MSMTYVVGVPYGGQIYLTSLDFEQIEQDPKCRRARARGRGVSDQRACNG
jgi:hypothetical protein